MRSPIPLHIAAPSLCPRALSTVVFALGLLTACGPHDAAVAPAQSPPPLSSLGEAVYEVLCNRVVAAHDGSDVSGAGSLAVCQGGQAPSHAAPPQLRVLYSQRQRLLAALDGAVTDDLKEALRALLTAILPLHDDGTLRAQAKEAVGALDQWAQDGNVLRGLARLSRRQGYTVAHAKLLRAVLAHPEMGDLIAGWATVVHDQPRAWATLRAGLYDGLTHHADDLTQVLRDLFGGLHEPLLRTADNANIAGDPRLTVVRRDRRGLALPNHNGAVAPPFVDRDRDGLADVDASGRFIDQEGRPLRLPTPFARAGVADGLGRSAYTPALRADGSHLWSYLPAQHSQLAQALGVLADVGDLGGREGSQVATVQAVLGALSADAGDGGREQLHLYLEGADSLARRLWPLRQQLTEVGLHLLQRHQAVGLGAWHTFGAGALQPDGMRSAPSGAVLALAQDLVRWLEAVSAHPGLLEDVLQALIHPDSALLGPELAKQMRHVDAIDFDPRAINGPVVGALVTATSPAQPTSTFARLLALVEGVNHRGLCNLPLDDPMPEYAPCALFEVPDVGTFYVDSLAGAATLTMRMAEDDFFFPDQFEAVTADAPGKSEMEAFTGIDGFTRVPTDCRADACSNHLTFEVTPQAASRLLFALYDARVPQDSPFALARAGVQQVTPRLLTADGRPFDEAFAGTVFAWELGHFPQAVRPLAQAFVAHHAQQLLLDLLTTLHRHWGALLAQDGNFERNLADQCADVSSLSAAQKLLGAVAEASDAAELMPTAPLAEVVRAAVTATENSPSPAALWLQAYGLGATEPGVSVLPQAPGRALAQDDAAVDDVPPWPHPAAWLNRPELQAGAKLLHAALEQPGTAAAIGSLWRRLLTDEREVTVIALADSLQLMDDLPGTAPLLASVAQTLLAPDGLLPHSMDVLRRLGGPGGLDTERVLPRLVARLFALPEGQDACADDAAAQEAPIEALVDIFLQLSRVEVGSAEPMEPEDIAASMAALRHFLADEDHGLMRILSLVDSRRGIPVQTVGAPQ